MALTLTSNYLKKPRKVSSSQGIGIQAVYPRRAQVSLQTRGPYRWWNSKFSYLFSALKFAITVKFSISCVPCSLLRKASFQTIPQGWRTLNDTPLKQQEYQAGDSDMSPTVSCPWKLRLVTWLSRWSSPSAYLVPTHLPSPSFFLAVPAVVPSVSSTRFCSHMVLGIFTKTQAHYYPTRA